MLGRRFRLLGFRVGGFDSRLDEKGRNRVAADELSSFYLVQEKAKDILATGTPNRASITFPTCCAPGPFVM